MTYFRGSISAGFQDRIRSVAQTFKFYLEIGGILVGEFLECGGLVMDREIVDISEGGVNDFIHRKPGKIKLGNITLKRGLTYDRDLWDWFRKGMYDGRVERKNLSIIIGNAEYLKVKQWDIFGAFPVKWSLIDLSASTMEIAWESVELVHRGIELSATEGTPIGAGLRAAVAGAPGISQEAWLAERQAANKEALDAMAARATASATALKAIADQAAADKAAEKEAAAAMAKRAEDSKAALEAQEKANADEAPPAESGATTA